jgi:hypothetical protein
MTGQPLRDHERARLWRDQGASSCAGLGLVTEEFDTLGLKASHFCVHAALPGNPNPLSGAGAKKQGLLRDCRNTAAHRRRSFLRLPRRAFIGGLRYGQGRLYTKNARDALR